MCFLILQRRLQIFLAGDLAHIKENSKLFTMKHQKNYDLAVIFPGIMLLHIPFFWVCKIHLDEVCS